MRILLIGPTLDRSIKSVGGSTILFEELITNFKKHNIPFRLIKTNVYKKKYLKIINFLSLLLRISFKTTNCQILFLNASDNLFFKVSPFIYILSKIFRKKLYIRMFGGCFDLTYSQQNKLTKSLLRCTTFKSDALFVETELQRNFIKRYFRNENRIYKFPNCRKSIKSDSDKSTHPFVFIGQVKKEKGLDFIIKANEVLPDSQKIHIYGPIWDIIYNNKLGDAYKGILKSEDVIKTIEKYKYLVLPTYWYGEGHPGVIVEAMSIGKPIIASNHRAIPELVSKKNGYLFDPFNFNDFISILLDNINNPNYNKLSTNSLKKFKTYFESEIVHNNIINKIRKIY